MRIRQQNLQPSIIYLKIPSFVKGLQKTVQGILYTEDVSNIDCACLHSNSKKTQG